MNINNEFSDVIHDHDDVIHDHDDVIHDHGDVIHDHDDVIHSNCDTMLSIRMPSKLKSEIHRQAEELGMSASSLAKVVLAQAFIK